MGCLAPAPVEVAAHRVYAAPAVRPVAVCRAGDCLLTVELPGDDRWTRSIRLPADASPGAWSARILEAGLTPSTPDRLARTYVLAPAAPRAPA